MEDSEYPGQSAQMHRRRFQGFLGSCTTECRITVQRQHDRLCVVSMRKSAVSRQLKEARFAIDALLAPNNIPFRKGNTYANDRRQDRARSHGARGEEARIRRGQE